jgi:hypothetical protein
MSKSFKTYCKEFYHGLPVIRELCSLKTALATQWAPRVQQIQAAAVFQALATLKASDPRYRDPVRLLAYGAQFWSQNFEDGMIAEIFKRIGVASRTFLEIGVGDGSENNTTALLAAGWSGWWIEGEEKFCRSISKRLEEMPALAARLKLQQSFVQPDSVGKLLTELKIPAEVDLFSLDIDLNTYHIWAALDKFRPRVVVVEYNAGIPPNLSWIHPFERDGVWDVSQDQGASLKAYELLGRKRGYSLVGCDVTGINAFFVRDDLLGNHFAAPFTSENHHEPPRHFLTCRFGHPSKFYGESHPES